MEKRHVYSYYLRIIAPSRHFFFFFFFLVHPLYPIPYHSLSLSLSLSLFLSLSPPSSSARINHHYYLALSTMAQSRWWTEKPVALVTGSNKGIGYEIVRQLAKEGLLVVLTARNEERGNAAVESLAAEGLVVDFHTLDVQDPDSVSDLGLWLKHKHTGLDILINNAAIADHELNYETATSVIDTNYEGVKRVTKELFPLLRESPFGARIVNISSALGQMERIKNNSLTEAISNVENLTEEKVDEFVRHYLEDVKDVGSLKSKGWPSKLHPSYCVSKVALNAYTRILAARSSLEGAKKVYVNCVAPGFVKTDINKNLGILTTEEGADTAVWLALLPPGGPSGQFFYERRLFPF